MDFGSRPAAFAASSMRSLAGGGGGAGAWVAAGGGGGGGAGRGERGLGGGGGGAGAATKVVGGNSRHWYGWSCTPMRSNPTSSAMEATSSALVGFMVAGM